MTRMRVVTALCLLSFAGLLDPGSAAAQATGGDVVTVTNDDAFETARNAAKVEGILCGISSGAAIWAALKVAKRPESAGKTIVTILASTGERYISTDLFKTDQ